jgi:hypothetical protein
MMSLEAIKRMSSEAATVAAATNERPFTYWNAAEVDELEGFPFPFLGDFEPPGWREVDRHFVDSSGFGADDEPALSARQFRQVILDRIAEVPGTGWAVVEAGQFQVYVAEFQREGGAA